MATPAQEFIQAVRCGDAATVHALLAADPRLCDVSQKSAGGASALHLAAQLGQLSIVRLLAGGGANVNKRSFDGSTPLHAAVSSGSLEIVQALVQAGADVQLAANNGYSPFDAAKALDAREILLLFRRQLWPGRYGDA